MVRLILSLVLILILSSLLYFLFNDVGNIEIYFSNYYIVISFGIFCILALLSVLLISAVIGIFWWLKNLPQSLLRLRYEYKHQKAVDEVFDIVCALESENKDLVLRLLQKANLTLIKHPITNLISWQAASLDKNSNELELEKKLLLMKEDIKTCIPAIKELINQKLKAAEFENANRYLITLEKLSYKPSWFYRLKITINIALQNWDEAIGALEKVSKLQLFSHEEVQSLFSLIHYLKAKYYLNQNLPNEAISTLRKSLSVNIHLESVVLLAELLCVQNKSKDAIEFVTKAWKVKPSYKLISSILPVYNDLPIVKKFEEVEKLISVNNSNQACLLLAHTALELGLFSKARKYLDLAKKEDLEYYRKLEAIYNICAQGDEQSIQDYLKELLGE
jgi:uncharacterized membrane-anchored protein